jgi:Putative transmembrane protein (PGPGW)
MNDILNSAVIHARRLIILVVGVTILAAGLAMIVLPGPAVAVIPLGLAVLGTEFIWARRLLRRVKAAVVRHGGSGKKSEA